MYLGMDLLEFILFEIFPTSWICRFVSSSQFGKFSTIIPLNIFQSHFSLCFGTLMMFMLNYFLLSHKFLGL